MKKLFYFTLIAFTFLSCSSDGVSNYNAFSITQCTKLDNLSGGFAKLQLTVKNNAQFTGGCWVYIKIKRGGVIIETSSVVYASLNPGESQIEEAWFSKFDRHSEYDHAEVILQWNVDSTNYSRSYSY